MPAEVRFDQSVTAVNVRVVGKERILSPLEHTWDSFFDGSAAVTEDFINQRATLEKSGQVIGVNDLHIAGHARSLGLAVVTNNAREFKRVDGSLVENWIEDED